MPKKLTTSIATCLHRWPYPRGWNRSTDKEKIEKWPEYCEPCEYCVPEVAKEDKRLAKGLTDLTPRDWNPRELYMLYSKGFRDGASVSAIRPDHQGLVAYDQGYADGYKARSEAVSAYCASIGYKPTILRTC